LDSKRHTGWLSPEDPRYWLLAALLRRLPRLPHQPGTRSSMAPPQRSARAVLDWTDYSSLLVTLPRGLGWSLIPGVWACCASIPSPAHDF